MNHAVEQTADMGALANATIVVAEAAMEEMKAKTDLENAVEFAEEVRHDVEKETRELARTATHVADLLVVTVQSRVDTAENNRKLAETFAHSVAESVAEKISTLKGSKETPNDE